MARCHLSLMLLAVLVALAAASPVPRQSPPATRAASSPLDLLDDMTRSLAPDMADPLPPQHHKLPKRASRNRAAVADEYLLPTNIRPVLYQVEIKPSFTKFTFTGLALIIVNVLETTNKIVLHAKDLQLDASNLDIYDDKTQYYFTAASSVTYDKEHDFATITTRAALKKGGRYQLNIYFDGVLNDDLDGFYRSSYKKSDGSTVWLATTQFETAGARRAFPCWDEPEYKARFYMIVDADSTRTAISNSELIEKKANSDGTTSYSYDGTLPISTYLIAFIVSDFASLSNAAGDFTVWARKDIISGGKFSNEVGEQALKLLGEYTGIPYILPKMEQAAIPDFAAGAMENWGLVTYREEYLIEQPSQTIRIAEYMATTICHELGHQWTGDLITLDWWSHTWLNEGFADYFENYICDQIKPEWHLRDKSVVGDHHRGMEYDALEDEHAMSSPVSSPDDASEKFDRISYSKGGAVVRMWENFLGIDVLKAGMNRYLSIYMFKNTNPEHLFKAIDFEAQKAGVLPYGVSFAEIARTWTEQPGVPVVTAVRDYNSNSLKLSQQRFFYSPPNRASLLAQRWHIPVTVVQQPGADWTNLKPTLWLTPSKDSATLSISKASSAQWVLVNPKEIGYYRVNYDIKNWNLLAKQLTDDHTVIPSASRAQLINDALALARAKQLDYPVALQLFNFLKAEREVAPWQSAVTALSYLRGKLAGTDAWTNFLTVLNKLTASAYSSVGYSGSTDHETRLLRYYVVSYACYAGNSDCIAKANAQLKSWLASSSLTLDSDTQAVSMCYGLRGADATSNFNGLKAKWLAEKDATARAALLAALACAQEDKLTGLLTDAVNKKLTGVSENDVVDIWRAVLNRPEQVGTLFNFAKNNYQQIDSYFSSGSSTSGAVRLLANCIQSITSSAQLEEARYWVESNYNGKTGYQTLQAAFLNTYTQLEWYRSNYKAVADWFATAATA